MTLDNLLKKLRKVNHKQYKQFWMCIAFANLLVSSFFGILFSDYIQSALPEGGDSRKQIYLIFGIAVVGCFVFVLYAMGLFLRYKSKELGVFLALGTEKQHMSVVLLKEVLSLGSSATVAGILTGNVFSILIGKVMENLGIAPDEITFMISWPGVLYTLVFSVCVFLCILIITLSFMRRSNVMDIMNEQRRCEPIKKQVTKQYLISGIFLLMVGVFMAYVLPVIWANIFKQYLSSLFTLFYGLCMIGIYRILVYSIVVHRRGRNPQKYYRNIISYGMLKFEGISMVRNMGLIVLLLIGALFASFYLPTNMMEGRNQADKNPVDVSYRVPGTVKGMEEKKVYSLAKEFGVNIQGYREIPFIELLSSGVNRDDVDDNGKLIEQYEKQAYYRQFVSDQELNKAMGTNIEIEEGTYQMIRSSEMDETIFFAFDDLDLAGNDVTGVEKELRYAGTVVFNELIVENGWDTFSRFVISEKDYKELKEGISEEHVIRQVLFNVNDLARSYDFSKKLYEEYCNAASEDMKVLLFYDAYLEKQALLAGDEYYEGDHIKLEPEHPEVDLNWKYEPYFKILFQKNMLLQYAVQFLLFAFVAIVMLASVGIIGYTRSQTIGLNSKQVYDDIRKLGADDNYILRCIKGQLRKVFAFPTLIGIGIIYLYQCVIYLQNDGFFRPYEVKAAVLNLGICLAVALYQYIGYCISLKEVKCIVGLR